jgi:hypothetical protein
VDQVDMAGDNGSELGDREDEHQVEEQLDRGHPRRAPL